MPLILDAPPPAIIHRAPIAEVRFGLSYAVSRVEYDRLRLPRDRLDATFLELRQFAPEELRRLPPWVLQSIFFVPMVAPSALSRTVVALTTPSASNQTYSVPALFNTSDNKIEVVSQGASGQDSYDQEVDPCHSDHFPPTTGNSGGYAKKTNVALTPGGSMLYRVRDYDAGTGDSGACWANGATLAASSVGIRGQAGGTTNGKGDVLTDGNNPGPTPPAAVLTLNTAVGASAGYGGTGNDTGSGTIQPGTGGMVVVTNNASLP